MPDLPAMLDIGISPALGTDSLASCDSLSVFDEMEFVCRKYPEVPPETVLAMATVNGADALGLSRDFGSLSPGKRADFLYIDLDEPNKRYLIERLIESQNERITNNDP